MKKEFVFFKNLEMVSNKRFTFENIISEDEIVIITDNVRKHKNGYVLVVDNNKVVYLKDWQVRKVLAYNEGIDACAVKLNRKFFKAYTFRNAFTDFHFEKEDTFDSLYEVAKEQQEQKMIFKETMLYNEDLKWLTWEE